MKIAGCIIQKKNIISYSEHLFEARYKNRYIYKSTLSFLGGVLVGIAVIEIIASYEPTVIDYMRGRVDVNIQETYVDSVLVKRDTIITYKK